MNIRYKYIHMKKIYSIFILFLVLFSGFSQTPNLLKMKIVGADGVDETVVRIISASTINFDNNYDAYKVLSTGVSQIYTLLPNNTMLSVNSIPDIITLYDIPLSVKIYADGQFNVNASGLLSFSNNLGIFLIDQFNGTVRNLKTDSLYSINAMVSQSSNRFLIRFIQRPLNPSSFSATSQNPHQIFLSVSPNANNDSIVVVFNQTGIFTSTIDGIAAGGINSSFAGGTVLYKGLSNGLPYHSGLSPNQHLYYKVFSYNSMKMYSSGLTSNATTLALPIIQVTSLNDFGNQYINTSSSDQSYTVSGSNLNANIIVFPTPHFEISSTGGAGFTVKDSIILPQTGGIVPASTIYVRFHPTAIQSYTERIVNVSNGADSAFLYVSGNGVSPYKTCSFNLFLEGLYNSNTNMMNAATNGITHSAVWGNGVADKINVELRQENEPYGLVLATNNVDLKTTGLAMFTISAEYNGMYFLKIANRNHLQTWSATPVSFAGDTIYYDFTNSAFKAYQLVGGNIPQAKVADGVYAFYLGDLNQSGLIDFDDFNLFEPALTYGTVGFVSSDFDGNGWVDADDFNLFEPRLRLGAFAQFPH